MANCKYIIGNNSPITLAELLAQLSDLDVSSYSDVVYSKYPRRDAMREKIIKVNKEYSYNKRKDTTASAVSAIIDGEPHIGDSKVFSISEFIDHPSAVIDGKHMLTQLEKEDYIQATIKQLVRRQNISEEEATKIVQNTLKSWKIIEEDTLLLHKLFTSDHLDSLADFQAQETLTSRMSMSVIDSLFKELKNFIRDIHFSYPEAKTLKNINLQAEINGFDKDLIGHIDYLFIDKRGTLHLYNFVTSHTHPLEWASVKEEKYKLRLAFLKQMLANKGINVKNISLNLVPMELQYNEDFTKLTAIKKREYKQYNLNKYNNPALNKYFNKAKYFIKSNISEAEDLTAGVKEANEVIKQVFPTLNIKAEGIETSAEEWIKSAPNSGDKSTPLIIAEVNKPNNPYDVIIYGQVFHIESAKAINKNPEILKVVKEHITELEDNKSDITQAVKNVLDKGIKTGFTDFQQKNILSSSSVYLDSIFMPYIQFTGDKKESEWEFNDQFVDQNIFIFKNKKTGQTDFITLTNLNLNAKFNLGNRTNLLGGLISDAEQYKTLNNQYGNVEAIRTLLLLNSTFSEIETDSMKLGQIKVISPMINGQCRTYDIGDLTKNYLPDIFKVVKRFNPESKVKNNLASAEFVDFVEVLCDYYNRVMEGAAEKTQDVFDKMGFGELTEANNNATKILAVRQILDTLIQKFPNKETLDRALQSRNTNSMVYKEAQLFLLVSKAYQYLTGEYMSYENKLSYIDKDMFTTTTVPDKNINIVVSNFLTTADTIAEQTGQQWNKYRPIIMDFYKKKGYTPAENATIGDQARQYENLYQKDEKGRIKMMFKNPYDDSADLKPEEREFLKKILQVFYDIRRTFNPNLKEITDAKKYIESNPSYLQVPLIKASGATVMQRSGALKSKARAIFKVFKDPSRYYDEFVENLIPEEAQELDMDVERLSLHNPFERQQDQQYRSLLLTKHEPDYFETNVENILAEVLNKYISVEKMNTFLIGTKNILFQLEMLGDSSKEVVDTEIKWIKDYLKINVFNRPIMGETGQTVVGILTPLRRAVTAANLAGNVVSSLRDGIQGYSENMIRTITKFQTDLTAKDVSEAYSYVVTNSVNNAMHISKLSALCAKYRISNSDLNRITERLRSGRGGILNLDNWMYSTLRSPDFINRMVLFTARCMHDGCWEAITVEDDVLKYNWKEDKRFKIFASGDVNHPEYNKQRSLYLSKIQEYNEEHPDNQLEYDNNNEIHLPEPYSQKEILSIRNIDRNIYGAYDKSMKSMGEYTASWWAFGMYTTWMNGMFNNYFMKPGEYQISQRQQIQQRNESGELLFFDEHGGLTTTDTGVPYVKGMPMIVQGIWYTIKELRNQFQDGGMKQMKEYLMANENEKRNMLKLSSDMLVSLLALVLTKLAFGEYKEYKKTMEDNPVISNLIVEVLYKASSRAWDSYQGPLNVLTFFGENMNPPIYQLPMQLIQDSWKFVLGDKTFGQLISGNFAIGRSYKDTYNSWLKAQE